MNARPWFPHAPEMSQAHRVLTELEYLAREHARTLTLALNALAHASSQTVSVTSDRISNRQLRGTEALGQACDYAARALSTYRTEMRDAEIRTDRLRHSGDAALTQIRAAATQWHLLSSHPYPAQVTWRTPPPLTPFTLTLTLDSSTNPETEFALFRWHTALTDLIALENHWYDCLTERASTTSRLTNALRATPLGALLALHRTTPPAQAPPANIAIAAGFSGEVAGRAAFPTPSPRATARIRWQLTGAHTTASAQHPVSPHRVARRWAALTPQQQQSFVANAPELVGNLSGIPLDVRDHALRTHLYQLGAQSTQLTQQQLRTVTELTRVLAEHDRASLPTRILTLDLSASVPRVAFALGDPVTASEVTVTVAGMHSDAPDAIRGWGTAAKHLYHAQNSAQTTPAGHAVITWLSYDTPDATEVLFPASAAAGAPGLAAELDSLTLSRTTNPPPQVHVVAHSYGTTLASLALTRIREPVATFTMLGSAGIDTRLVPKLSDLQVAPIAATLPQQQAIFTGHSPQDGLAPLGAALSGRALPHRDAREWGQRASPLTRVLPGALSFSVQGDPENGLAATNGHSVQGSGTHPGVLGSSASAGHGYLDPGTQSLATVARITTGGITERDLPDFHRVTR